MEEAISAADAKRRFSHLLREVRKGRHYVVISDGTPVARLIPADKHKSALAGARTALLSRLEEQPLADAGRWTRPDVYNDDQ